MTLSKSEGKAALYFDCHPHQSPRHRLWTVLGVNLNVKTQDLIAAVREGRERPRRYD
jgi:hypothetical protein